MLGAIYCSSIFPQSAPGGRFLVRVMAGGMVHPEAVARDEEDLAAAAEAMLRGYTRLAAPLVFKRVYKVRDPRADVLAAAAERLFTRGGDMTLYRLARDVEAVALRLLEEQKPGRRLQTNVEFYTALVLHGLGFDVPLFTPTFAVSRVAGWIGHAREQQRANRLIRPQSTYVGPRDRHWVAIEDRVETAAGAA